MRSQDKITWREPYRETWKDMLSEARSAGILRPAFWVRTFGCAYILTGGLVAWMMAAYPGIVLPWGNLLAAAAVVPVILAVTAGVHCIIPRFVTVHREWILIMNGNHSVRIPRERIDAVTLDYGGDDPSPHLSPSTVPPRLTVIYRTHRGKARTKTVAVGSKVDLGALTELVESFNGRP